MEESFLGTTELLIVFVCLRFVQHLAERVLATKNINWVLNTKHQEEAQNALGIPKDEMAKASHYGLDKFKFSNFAAWVHFIIGLIFICAGGLGVVEGWAIAISSNEILTGLAFLGILGGLSSLLELPFDYYHTFVLEERHGFNKQTLKTFMIDRIKGALLALILGGGIVALILWIMDTMDHWWLWAWLVLFGFNLIMAWLYPSLLAPLFNKFSPLADGELKDKLFSLARKVEFDASSISIMNASMRSSHGNAYFTGVFGKKKIVLFDTLVDAMNPDEICAVLAHELGHFKLHHIRATLIRSFFVTGLIFYLLHLCLPLEAFYKAFFLSGTSHYGALVVFSLWFGPISFLIQPVSTWLSRRNEFAADAFALKHLENKRVLGEALLKLRQKSHGMPISHPAFSTVYHSHPPLLERLKAMNFY